MFEKNNKLGGLNEYGIAAYKSTDEFAQREVDFILSIGNIKVYTGKSLGKDIHLKQLSNEYDAVFLACGLSDVNALGLDHEYDTVGVEDAIAYIERIRQTRDVSSLSVPNEVLVIGGGMTAVDIAVQVKKLGARDVTIVYRRGFENMGASEYEQHIAQTNGVAIQTFLAPEALLTEAGKVMGMRCRRTQIDGGRLQLTDETVTLNADVVFKAIGQKLHLDTDDAALLAFEGNKIVVDTQMKTTLDNVWAGGDCVDLEDDLTVVAVEHGKRAAQSMHTYLSA